LSYFGGGFLRQSRRATKEDRKDCESVAHDDFVVVGNKWWWEKGGGFVPAPLPRVYTNYKETALSRVVLGEFSRLLAALGIKAELARAIRWAVRCRHRAACASPLVLEAELARAQPFKGVSRTASFSRFQQNAESR
jgi:hypothetical protein